MPIYEYQCAACGELHEALQKISDPPLTDCPACGRAALRRKVSAVAFRLKGGGWYETDFKSGDKKNLAGDPDGAKRGSGEGGGDAPAGDSGAKSGREGGDKSRNNGDSKGSNQRQGSDKTSAKGSAGPPPQAGSAASQTS